MVMDLSNQGFFRAYLQALTDKQLKALDNWNSQRMSTGAEDAAEKKRLIHLESRRRR